MSTIDVACKKSIGFSNDPCNTVSGNICIGEKRGYMYWSYLYFDLSNIPNDVELIAATLVLFKTLAQCNKYDRYEEVENQKYRVIPLLDYMTEYSYCYDLPKLEDQLASSFIVDPYLSYTEIDITPQTAVWLSEELENKGIILMGNKCCKWIEYGGEDVGGKNVRPFLRVKYKMKSLPWPDIYGPIIDLPISIKIA